MHPNKRNFIEGLGLILKRWTALQLAVEMEWAGPFTAQKAVDLEESLIEYFEKEGKNLEPEDIEDILLDVMRDEFGAILEDESEVEVARSMFLLYSQSVKGETAFLETLRSKALTQTPILDACKDQSPPEEELPSDIEIDDD